MARSLVTGVDVWINTPEYPLEASGTSGEKAAINGVLNLSVLDGWWGEAFNGKNGWGISPHGVGTDPEIRDREEANDLLDIMEHEIIPIFYNRGQQGYSKYWVKLSKGSMKSCIPRFNASRMVMDYVKKLYSPAKKQNQILAQNNAEPARELAAWKKKVRDNWHHIRMERLQNEKDFIQTGESLNIQVSAYLNGLSAEDIVLECVVGQYNEQKEEMTGCEHHFFHYEKQEKGNHIFSLQLKPSNSGLNHYRVRMYPYHKLLSHPFETGCLIWL